MLCVFLFEEGLKLATLTTVFKNRRLVFKMYYVFTQSNFSKDKKPP